MLRNNLTEEALIYKTIDSTDTLKPTKISDFRQSLVTGASTTESKELPALHQKHLIKNINAQANHYGQMIEQQKRKIMQSAALLMSSPKSKYGRNSSLQSQHRE